MDCVVCGTPLQTRLETFGAIDAPMCQSCHLGLLCQDDPYAQQFFSYDDLGNGWLLKRLTEAGAAFLGGKPGDALMRVNRAEGKIEIVG